MAVYVLKNIIHLIKFLIFLIRKIFKWYQSRNRKTSLSEKPSYSRFFLKRANNLINYFRDQKFEDIKSLSNIDNKGILYFSFFNKKK